MPSHGAQLDLERCPHCSVDRPHLNKVATTKTSDFRGTNERTWYFYACQRCGGVVSAWSHKGSTQIVEMYPASMEVDAAVPNRAREYLDQAINSISAPAGAVMLVSSAVDSMLKEKGLVDGTLYSRINKASEKHLITEEMAKWAHEVRLDANDQRHADVETELPNEKDARRVIEFAHALSTFLFVLPARVSRGIETAQKGQQTAPSDATMRRG